jgi:hypothetical protein
MRRAARPTLLASMMALGLSLALASQAFALTWSPERVFGFWSSTYGVPGGTSATSDGTLHLVYEEYIDPYWTVVYRRSMDGGLTWKSGYRPATTADAASERPSISASALYVDLLWVETDETRHRLTHRRSADGGTTWGRARVLSSGTSPVMSPRVARDGAGHVLVTWTNGSSGQINVRVSSDGGLTFGNATAIASTSLAFSSGHDGRAVPVIGSQFAAIAYSSSPTTIRLRRTTDWGATWSTPATITSKGSWQGPGAIAAGSTVLVGYATQASDDSATVYRRSTNKAASWGGVITLAPMSSLPAFAPVFGYAGGKWRVAYERCTTNACVASRIRYAESSNGSTWSAAETVSSGGEAVYVTPIGIARTSRTLVAYTAFDADEFPVVITRSAP